MHILVINPNSTASMTASVAEAARRVAAKATQITAVTCETGPASIQGPEDGVAALPGLFKVFDDQILGAGGFDAVIIACFDDTGLAELKARAQLPVIGIGEAAYHAAMLMAPKFSVVTTLAVSIPVIEKNLRDYGFSSRCARVRASGVPVLDIGGDGEGGRRKIAAEIGRALSQEAPGAIVLGCAGMAELAADLTQEFGLPVIDGVAAAVALAQALDQMTFAGVQRPEIARSSP